MKVKVFIKRHLKDGKTIEAAKLLKKIRCKAMNYNGYISGETLISVNDPQEINVLSFWQSMDDWNSWKESDERKLYDARLNELQTNPTLYEPFVFSRYKLAAKAGFPALENEISA